MPRKPTPKGWESRGGAYELTAESDFRAVIIRARNPETRLIEWHLHAAWKDSDGKLQEARS